MTEKIRQIEVIILVVEITKKGHLLVKPCFDYKAIFRIVEITIKGHLQLKPCFDYHSNLSNDLLARYKFFIQVLFYSTFLT